MLSALKNLVRPSKKKTGSSEEVVIPISHNDENKSPNVTKTKRLFPGSTFSYFIKDEESWNQYFKYAYEKMLSNGIVYDANYRSSPIINGPVADKIEKKISEKIKNEKIDALKFLCLEQDALGNITFPSIRMEWSNGKEVNLKNFLNDDSLKERNLRAISLCHSDENKKKGMHLLILEDGTRLYEAIDGSYEMKINWFVEGKECKIKVSISGDGSVEFLERNGVTEEELSANTEIKIIQNCKGKTLHELLAPQLQQKSSEEMKVLSQKNSEAKDFVAKNPEMESELKVLGSQLQQKSPEEQSSVKQEIKYPEKELKQLGGSWGRLLPNMPDPKKWDISEAVDHLGGPSTDLREVKNTLLLKKGLISERTLSQLG